MRLKADIHLPPKAVERQQPGNVGFLAAEADDQHHVPGRGDGEGGWIVSFPLSRAPQSFACCFDRLGWQRLDDQAHHG